MHGKFRPLSPGKAGSQGPPPPPVCSVFVFSYHRGCEDYSFTRDGYGIFNMLTNWDVCCTHKGGSDTNKSAQELTQEGQKNGPSPCPTRGSNPGSLDLNSDALTTELRPLSNRDIII